MSLCKGCTLRASHCRECAQARARERDKAQADWAAQGIVYQAEVGELTTRAERGEAERDIWIKRFRKAEDEWDEDKVALAVMVETLEACRETIRKEGYVFANGEPSALGDASRHITVIYKMISETLASISPAAKCVWEIVRVAEALEAHDRHWHEVLALGTADMIRREESKYDSVIDGVCKAVRAKGDSI